jgi:hypothetical protein
MSESSSPAPVPATIRFAWLLEKTVDGRPAYWDGGHAESFTRDADRAVQFARRTDCLWACRHLIQWNWQFVEHGFIGSALASSAPAEPPAPAQE